MRASATLFAAALLLSTTQSSRAESTAPGPRCTLRYAPDGDRPIPTNAPALALEMFSTTGQNPVVEIVSVDPTATFTQHPDPRAPNTMLFLPRSALQDDTSYFITTRSHCPGVVPRDAQAPGHQNGGMRFATTRAVPLPAVAGTAAAHLDESRVPRVEVSASKDLVAYLHVLMLEVFAGQELWTSSSYGTLLESAGMIRFGLPAYPLDDAHCGDSGQATVKAQIRFHVAGATSDPRPLDIDVPISCTASPTPPQGPTDAGADDPGVTNAANTSSGDGCNASGASSGFGLFFLVVGVLAFLKAAVARR